jgi:hypothetical protein
MPVQRPFVPLTPKTVKLCELCGTLNLDANKECWTCAWHGGFSRDPKTIALAWQRLETRYESVRLEHVTSRRARPVGDFGHVRPATGPRRLVTALAAWWQRFQDARDLRMAQRQARLHSRMPSPPDQLSI